MDVVPERPSLNSEVEAYREAIAELRKSIDTARDQKPPSDLQILLITALTARDAVKTALEQHKSDERKLLPIIVTLDEELRVLAKLAQQQGHFDISHWHDLISKGEPLDEWWQLGDSITPLFNRYSVSIDTLSAMVVTKGGNIRHLLSAALNDRNELKTVLAANPADAQSWRSRTAALDERLYSEGLVVLRRRFIEMSSWLALMSSHSPLDSWWHLDDPIKPTLDVYCLTICSLSDAVERSDKDDTIEWPELLINTLMARDALKAALVAYPAKAPLKVPKIAEFDDQLRELGTKAQRLGNFDISRWHNLISENPALDAWWHFRDSVTPALEAYGVAVAKLSRATNAAFEKNQIPQERNRGLLKRIGDVAVWVPLVIWHLLIKFIKLLINALKMLIYWLGGIKTGVQKFVGIYKSPHSDSKFDSRVTPPSELVQLLIAALTARDSLKSVFTTSPLDTNLFDSEVVTVDKELYGNALNVLNLGEVEMSIWLKLVSAQSPLDVWKHLDDPLTPTIDAYDISLQRLIRALDNPDHSDTSNLRRLLFDTLTARDALKDSLTTNPSAARPRLTEILDLDNQLYPHGMKALRVGKFDLSTSRSLITDDVSSPWWQLDDPLVIRRGSRDFFFKLIGAVLFGISFAIIGIKTGWLLQAGSEVLGIITATVQIILGGALATKGGRDLALEVIRVLPLPWPKRFSGQAFLASGTLFLMLTTLTYFFIFPKLARYFHEQGQIALGVEDGSLARSQFETALKIEPNFTISLIQLGILYRSIGDETTAQELLEDAIASDSRLVIAHSELADIYINKAENDKALRLLNHGVRVIRSTELPAELIEITSKELLEYRMLVRRGRLLIDEGEIDAGLIDLEQARTIAENSPEQFGPEDRQQHTTELYGRLAEAYLTLYMDSCDATLWDDSKEYWTRVVDSGPDVENLITERRWNLKATDWLQKQAPPCSIKEN